MKTAIIACGMLNIKSNDALIVPGKDGLETNLPRRITAGQTFHQDWSVRPITCSRQRPLGSKATEPRSMQHLVRSSQNRLHSRRLSPDSNRRQRLLS
ncbi:hypothetical protein SAMN05421753_106239 [Planctomicrobium piriforme]|uniref:Uncharacterized protein n=1 Tax=Planctomicrobium piriforme TaxID=1576369 RepID=A0A1I3G8M0_9PLAN|nr:hypothetical protein SAMN05421753_106239 [Planctomicrobium piriforme]